MSKIARPNVQAHLGRIVRRIVKKFHPEQIILFGSHARGDAGARDGGARAR
jgi:predicted nucleotidyltransferase